MKSPFKALPGFVICKIYVDNGPFASEKEVAGDSQVSQVLEIGDSYIDIQGNKRGTQVKVGDVILHRYTSDDITIKFDKYRIVHFDNIFGIKK